MAKNVNIVYTENRPDISENPASPKQKFQHFNSRNDNTVNMIVDFSSRITPKSLISFDQYYIGKEFGNDQK